MAAETHVRNAALGCAYLITAVAVLGASSIVPALPALGSGFGVSASQAAWVIGVFIAPAVLLTPFLGALADRVGIRRIVISALIVYAVSAVACFFATSFSALLGFRFAQGVGAAALELLALMIIATVAAPDEMRRAMGRNASVIGLCLCLYPAISGFLVDWNWPAVFLLGVVAVPVAIFVYFRLSPDLLRVSQSTERGALAAIFQLTRAPEVTGQYALIIGLFILLFGCFFSFVPEIARANGITSGVQLGTLPLVMALAIALVAPMMDWVARRIGEGGVFFSACTFYAVSLSGFAYAQGYAAFLIAAAIFGAGHGLLFPLTQSVLGRNAPSTGQGIFMSANAMSIAIGQTLGPFLVGAVVSQTSVTGGMFFGVCVAVAMLLLAQFVGRRAAR